MEQPDDGVLYFCGGISANARLHFSNVSGESSYTPSDVIQLVALPSSTQDNCYVCSADYARTAGGGVSQEYVDQKVQDEADARVTSYDELKAAIPTKVSELSNDSGYLTYEGTIANADRANNAANADNAENVLWGNVQSKPTTVSGYGITDAATIEYVDNAIGNVLTQEVF